MNLLGWLTLIALVLGLIAGRALFKPSDDNHNKWT